MVSVSFFEQVNEWCIVSLVFYFKLIAYNCLSCCNCKKTISVIYVEFLYMYSSDLQDFVVAHVISYKH